MWGRLVKCNGPLLRSSAYHCQPESFKARLWNRLQCSTSAVSQSPVGKPLCGLMLRHECDARNWFSNP